ncbi:DUF305 domain-containing protein [Spirilliplanes yamanashiensis]|uniref:Lipoprotein n=1 Tax=Spirilliplanes yamanashiensis TaxID=42233 RepID=A0A8J3YFD2_9ACTN|nr:DUF305 domain-containing protein [Spirilliplanes yamanashiensis]MDP9818432.1 uncharacterized protein (DUF305 family) [Spirilliplanes yamanashiensis]GIJ06653.1 lipoprotein [Spirilliplanes yamanashiensis]
MYNNPVVRRITLAASAAGAALILSACGSSSSGPEAGEGAEPAGASQPSQAAASFNDADVAFAQMMIPDHKMVAEMGELAEKKADTSELKALAKEMKKESETAQTLEGLLTAWGKPASGDTDGMDMPGAMTDKDMDMLDSMSGMEFDMMFAEMMVKHHEGSLKMVRDAQTAGASAEAKALADDMLQNKEEQLEKLRKIAEMDADGSAGHE